MALSKVPSTCAESCTTSRLPWASANRAQIWRESATRTISVSTVGSLSGRIWAEISMSMIDSIEALFSPKRSAR
ncbi:hypothetical protein D3C72_1151590 [compost metagenome]